MGTEERKEAATNRVDDFTRFQIIFTEQEVDPKSTK